MLHAVIMAGGAGTRFWPESRAQRPKQLLEMIGGRTMIQSTVDRLHGLVPRQRMMIATTAALAPAIGEQLPDFPSQAILAEPCKRDTAPCIGLAATCLVREDPEAIMAVMPADHVIAPDESFCDAIRFAAALIEERPGRIVTFGIRPTYPAESFGYIERGAAINTSAAQAVPYAPAAYQVRQFREKPSTAKAQEYLAQGSFYWNAGIFLWRAQTVLDALARYQPDLHARLQKIAATVGTPAYEQVLADEFAAMHPISIDYAVMEHAEDVVVVEAPFDWDDVGSWQAVARLCGTDADGNTISAKHLGIKTTGAIVRGDQEHLIVTVGMSDCIIVHTPDATLVANRRDEESIRHVVKLLEQQGWREYL